MTKYLLSLLLFCLSTPVFAQGVDDCPPGHARHTTFTGLDHAALDAAAAASFIGLYHRQPSRVRGSGVDDIENWIDYANHFGLYGDDVCRAGWNLYRENQLGGLPSGPADGDQPARFQPTGAPPVPPVPPPVPPVQPPAPIFSDAAILAQLAALKVDVAGVKQDIADFREAARSRIAAIMKSPLFQIISAAITTWATTYVVTKH